MGRHQQGRSQRPAVAGPCAGSATNLDPDRHGGRMSHTPDSLAGKTALVTGGSRGIGRAIALALGRRGAHVAVHYNAARDAADEVVALIRDAGGRAWTLQADLASSDA